MRYATLWPGLVSVWYRGSARGLLLSVLFSWAICFLLLATFVWQSWVSNWIVVLLWCSLGCYWLFELVRSQFAIANMVRPASDEANERFENAQREYLKGNWYEAEAKLLDVVSEHSDDVAAILLLVGVLRHTRRWRPALRRLEQLTLMDAAAGWQFEIRQEKQRVESAMQDEREELAEESSSSVD